MPAWPQHPREALNNISMNLVLLFIAWCGQLGTRLDSGFSIGIFYSFAQKERVTRTDLPNYNKTILSHSGVVKRSPKARMNDSNF
jgi:hypothetical protein